jgi:DNA-binding NarL/FixJ family response regulator
MIGVLLADDQALVRGGFRLILESEPDLRVLGEAADGQEAVSLTKSMQPDVVLMDLRMPRLDGIEATARIVSSGSSARVVVLTTFDAEADVYAALKAGASGFLLKDIDPPDLVAAVRAAVRGDTLLAPSLTRRLIDHYVETGRRPTDPRVELLAEREREVLLLIASGRSNAEIARHLHLSETTVKTHVTRMLTKLAVRDRVQAVIVAYQTGLVRPSTDDASSS